MFAAKLDCQLVQVFMFVVVFPLFEQGAGCLLESWRTTQLFSLFLLLLRMICQLYFMFPEDKCDHKTYACAHSQRPAKQQLLWQSTFLVFGLASKLDEAYSAKRAQWLCMWKLRTCHGHLGFALTNTLWFPKPLMVGVVGTPPKLIAKLFSIWLPVPWTPITGHLSTCAVSGMVEYWIFLLRSSFKDFVGLDVWRTNSNGDRWQIPLSKN